MRWAAALAAALVLVPGAAAYKNPTPGRALVVQIIGMHRARVVHGPGLDVYRARGAKGRLPAVIVGGRKGSAQSIGWAQLISSSGLAAVAARNVSAAMAYVRAHAAKLGIDAGRLCTLGFGTGVAASLHDAEPWLRCSVAYYGALEADPALLSPMLVVEAGRAQPAVNESIDRFAATARRLHADVRVLANADAAPGFDVGRRTSRSRAVVKETLRYLQARLEKPLRITEGCASSAEKASVLRFFTPQDVQLAGVVVGTGPRGIVLSHGSGGDLCEWLPYARELASAGYRVLSYDSRTLLQIDREMAAAVEALRRTGATRVAVAGSSLGALAALTGAARLSDQPDAVISLSSPDRVGSVDGVAAVHELHVPVLFVAEEEDQPFSDDARTLYAAAGSAERRLEIFPGGDHGVGMLRTPAIRTLFDQFLAAHLGAPALR
jgi:dienelactone hydrolase